MTPKQSTRSLKKGTHPQERSLVMAISSRLPQTNCPTGRAATHPLYVDEFDQPPLQERKRVNSHSSRLVAYPLQRLFLRSRRRASRRRNIIDRDRPTLFFLEQIQCPPPRAMNYPANRIRDLASVRDGF